MDGVKDEKNEYYGSSLKNQIFRVGWHEKPIYWEGGGDCLKRGDLDSLQISGVGLTKKRGGGVFLRGGEISQCTLWFF